MSDIAGLVPTTELEAVNAMFATTGDTPVASITPGARADVDFALNTIRLVAKTVQSRGWLFNTDRAVVLTRDAITHKIAVPTGTLRLKKTLIESNRDVDVTIRGGFLWDRVNNVDTFASTATVDIVLALDFTDLPETARAMIFIMAARRYQQQTLGNTELSGFGLEDEKAALANLTDAEGILTDTDFLMNFPDQRMVNQVLRAVSREVQTEGWKFNLRLNVPMTPNDDDNVLLTSDILRARKSEIAGQSHIDCAQRGDRMYNVRENSDIFPEENLAEGLLYLDLVMYLELADLPPVALKYIKIKAARQLQNQRTGIQPPTSGFTEEDEKAARLALVRAEGHKEPFNMLRNMTAARVTGFRPNLFGTGKVRRGPHSLG